MKIHTLFFLLFCCQSGIAQQNDYNLDFEYWDTASLQSDSAALNNTIYNGMHKVEEPYRGTLLDWNTMPTGTYRTSDAYSGNYALVIHQWYGNTPGVATLGNCSISTENCLTALPQIAYGLSGYYKLYHDDSIHTAGVGNALLFITTYTIDTITGNLQESSADTFTFTPTEDYTYFNLSINYKDRSQKPDSVQVRFHSGSIGTGQGSCIYPMCYFLYLDALELHYAPYTGIKSPANLKKKVKLYPNPVKDKIRLQYNDINVQKLQLTGLSGRVVRSFHAKSTNLDITGLPPGMYLLQMDTNEGMLVKKVVVQ